MGTPPGGFPGADPPVGILGANQTGLETRRSEIWRDLSRGIPPGDPPGVVPNHAKNDLTHQLYPVFCAEYHGTIGWVDSLTRFWYFEVDSPRENPSIFRHVWFRAPFGLPRALRHIAPRHARRATAPQRSAAQRSGQTKRGSKPDVPKNGGNFPGGIDL